MTHLHATQGDHHGVLVVDLSAHGQTVDLTGADVAFRAKLLVDGTVTIVGPAEVVSPTNPARVLFRYTAAQVARAGDYRAKWVASYPGGEVQTFPTPEGAFDRLTVHPHHD